MDQTHHATFRAKLAHRACIAMLLGITVLCATLGMAALQFVPAADIVLTKPNFPVAAVFGILTVISQTLTLKLVYDPRCAP